MNTIQRVGMFVFAALFCVLLLLHGPWYGYVTEISSFGKFGGIHTELDFSSWRTKAPVILWFGYVVNFLTCASVLIVLLGVWIYLFRSK